MVFSFSFSSTQVCRLIRMAKQWLSNYYYNAVQRLIDWKAISEMTSSWHQQQLHTTFIEIVSFRRRRTDVRRIDSNWSGVYSRPSRYSIIYILYSRWWSYIHSSSFVPKKGRNSDEQREDLGYHTQRERERTKEETGCLEFQMYISCFIPQIVYPVLYIVTSLAISKSPSIRRLALGSLSILIPLTSMKNSPQKLGGGELSSSVLCV
jgi:hypothetical protein